MEEQKIMSSPVLEFDTERWNPKKRALRLVLSVSILLLGIFGTIFASFMLKHDAAWLSVLAIGIGATVKGALMIDNYL